MRISSSAKRKARDYWARRLLNSSPRKKAGQLLWRAGITGLAAFSLLNILVHWFVYSSKSWVSTPITSALALLTLAGMGTAIIGSIVGSSGGGRG